LANPVPFKSRMRVGAFGTRLTNRISEVPPVKLVGLVLLQHAIRKSDSNITNVENTHFMWFSIYQCIKSVYVIVCVVVYVVVRVNVDLVYRTVGQLK